MEQIIMHTIGAIKIILFFFVVYCLSFNKYLDEPVSKEKILEKIGYLHKNVDTLPKIILYVRLLRLRMLLRKRLRHFTAIKKDDHGKKTKIINYDEISKEWYKCVDYLCQIFNRRENGPYRELDLQTLKAIVEDTYKLLKN